MKRLPASLLLVPLLLVAPLFVACAAHATDPSPYQHIPPRNDGSGTIYMGRETAGIMGHEGAGWLERPDRDAEERPDLLMQALALSPGMQVADIGAGTGYFSWRLADRVGPTGRVLAVDVQPEMLALLAGEMRRRGKVNVTGVLGTPTDPRLPPRAIDVVLMVDVYHEFDHPREMLEAIGRALKPGGRLVFVEYRQEDPNVGILPHHTMSEAQVRREAAASGYVWHQTIETLPKQHIVVFTLPEQRPAGPAAETRKSSPG